MTKPNIAIDFDGVIHAHKNPIEGRRMGPPIEGAKEALKTLSRKYNIIIFSVWGDKPKTIEDFMKYYELSFNSVTNIKPNATFYIDDRGLHFNSWSETLAEVDKRSLT